MIVIYKDITSNAIFIENANGVQFINSLQATINSSGKCSIIDLARNIEIVSNTSYNEFEDDNGNIYGDSPTEVCNNLNAIFQSSGSTGQTPNITSSTAITLTVGDTLNYELIAEYGVGYEWDLSNVSGLATVEGNIRKLVGGSSLSPGTYNIPVKAINYYGEDSETIVLTVNNPPYNNTKSVLFNQNDYCDLTANTSNPFYRLNQDSATAWSVCFWFKAGSSNNQNQTLLSFGGSDLNNNGRVQIKYNGNNAARRRMYLEYGTNFNNLIMYSPTSSTAANTWDHWMFVYDGGTTENGSGGINDSYSRFSIYKNGVLQTKTNTNNNYGFSGEIVDGFFRLGRLVDSEQYLRGCNIDELAIWASDESSNISSIYNSGTPHDLSLLASPPANYWRMGDGDTFPTLQDNIGSLDATMTNMTVSDIVNDVP